LDWAELTLASLSEHSVGRESGGVDRLTKLYQDLPLAIVK
jgi:hypothetical protein